MRKWFICLASYSSARSSGVSIPLIVSFFEPGHFIMQTQMLRGIKQRVESNRDTEST